MHERTKERNEFSIDNLSLENKVIRKKKEIFCPSEKESLAGCCFIAYQLLWVI